MIDEILVRGDSYPGRPEFSFVIHDNDVIIMTTRILLK